MEGYEEVCVLIEASEYHKTCGRARRPNYFMLVECTTPPHLLSDVDSCVWRRIRLGILIKSSDRMCSFVAISLAVIIPWFLCLFLLSSEDGQATLNDDHPRLIKFFYIWTVLGFIILFVVVRKYDRNLKEGRQQVVSAMVGRFEQQGYNIEYVKICGGCYVRFTPTGRGRQIPVEDDDSDLAVFNLNDWNPLEGKWEETDGNKNTRWVHAKQSVEFQTIGSCADISIEGEATREEEGVVESDSFTLDDNEVVVNTFVSKGEMHGRIFGFYGFRATYTGTTIGNTHVIGSGTGDGTKIIPITVGGGGIVACYRYGDSRVMIVRGPKMLQIDLGFEEIPPVSQLISDDSVLKEGRAWIEFQRTELDHHSSTNFLAEIV